MQRLRAYVRRTLIEKATEYAHPHKRRTAESTRSACMDALRGTDTGWWSDLIYNDDVLALFNRYRSDVRETIREYLDETGCELSQQLRADDLTTFADLLAATGRRQSLADYMHGTDARHREADAAMTAIRFAVEYQAGEVARLLAPDL